MEMHAEHGQKKAQPRGFAALPQVRRELARVYAELRACGPGDPAAVTHYRALGYLLQGIADILAKEKMQDLESRIEALESQTTGDEP